MKHGLFYTMALGLGIAVFVPDMASAQIADRVRGRPGQAQGSTRQDPRDRRDVDPRDRRDIDEWETDARGGKKGGPPFCRNGQGHPVHGRRWCVDKGFGLGSGRSEWDQMGWNDVTFRMPRDSRDRDAWLRRGTLDGRGLADVLGSNVYGRLNRYGDAHGWDGALGGSWLGSAYGSGLHLRLFSGGIPVADLVDLNRDGRVDTIRLLRFY